MVRVMKRYLKMIISRLNLVVIISNMLCLLEFCELKKSTCFTCINASKYIRFRKIKWSIRILETKQNSIILSQCTYHVIFRNMAQCIISLNAVYLFLFSKNTSRILIEVGPLDIWRGGRWYH